MHTAAPPTLPITEARTLAYKFPKDYGFYEPVSLSNPAALVSQGVILAGYLINHRIQTISKGKQDLLLQKWMVRCRKSGNSIECARFFPMDGGYFGSAEWKREQDALFSYGSKVEVHGVIKDASYDSGERRVERYQIAADTVIPRPETWTDTTIIVPKRTKKTEVEPHLLEWAIAMQDDPMHPKIIQYFKLMGLQEALTEMHHPTSKGSLEAARRRLVFDEFFYLQLHLLQLRAAVKAQKRPVNAVRGKLLAKFYEVLPFTLTNAQQRVVSEIGSDMAQGEPMNRLVQGDVGSGKTVVAVAAALIAIEAGYQVALMAPTEVLAEQHYRKIAGWFDKLGLKCKLLTGSTRKVDRANILFHLEHDPENLHLVVGTQALLTESVRFQKLGLVIVDEQHRFGVDQRAALLAKGDHPHLLSMTATPIPRSLALTLHGDLDVSQIDELPPGRKPIVTRVANDSTSHRSKIEALIRSQVSAGRQAYIILPLVKESSKIELTSAIEEYGRLQQVFPQFRLGLLHGKLKATEKDLVLQEFYGNITQILVSTTVVEVGVDVPNATIMLIEHAERFGLAQLHQLRGRVGRGQHKSYCILVDRSAGGETQRLQVMEQSQDGFYIAEADLIFRGPGELLGTKQSGLPEFALANLTTDHEILGQARYAAEKVVQYPIKPAVAAELQYRCSTTETDKILN